MKPRESRPRAGLIASALVSLLLGVLFFMPWLAISYDPQGLMQSGGLLEGVKLPVLPTELTEPIELARAGGPQLAQGHVTPAESPKKSGPAMSDDTLVSRWWVYAGLALPALLLVACVAGLADKVPPAVAGKIMFLLAFGGASMMYAVSRVSCADDIVDKARGQIAAHMPAATPSAQTDIEQSLDEMAECLNDVILTRPTPVLWVTMGAYGVACICALWAIGSPPTASERAIAERTAMSRPGETSYAVAPPSPQFRNRRNTAAGALPQFGPDLFTPSSPAEPDPTRTGRTG